MENPRLNRLKEFLLQSPEDSFLRYGIALEYAGMGNESEAIKHLEDLKNHDSEYLPTYYQLGKLYEKKRQNEWAILNYRQGIEIAKRQKDNHTLSELNAALDDLLDL